MHKMILSKQKIVLIGSGNLATWLSETLKGKRDIIQVYSRTLTNAKKLGKKIGCSYTDELKKISSEADLYIIAVKDAAIKEVAKKLKLTGKIVVHTSGSVSIDVLNRTNNKTGVLWPLYSFSNTERNKSIATHAIKIPFFVEASDKKTEKELASLVKDMKSVPNLLNSEKRAIIHLAAVFANNFPNHLFSIAECLCKEAGVSVKVLLPIVEETVENLKTQSPLKSQTGPASRNDKQILSNHIALLANDFRLHKMPPIYKEVYEILTKSIIQTQRGKKEL
jgi:predicted short-subunit dehydrogenase-like oxidoreductase (DUF2520 family)